MTIQECKPGQRIRVNQTIERREGSWHSHTTGTLVESRLQKTGSWYAHARDDKLWLMRIVLRKDDGELTTLNLDPLTEIELLEAAPGPAQRPLAL